MRVDIAANIAGFYGIASRRQCRRQRVEQGFAAAHQGQNGASRRTKPKPGQARKIFHQLLNLVTRHGLCVFSTNICIGINLRQSVFIKLGYRLDTGIRKHIKRRLDQRVCECRLAANI